MCDSQTEKDIEKFLSLNKLNRRNFGKMMAASGIVAAFPQFAIGAADVTEQQVTVTTRDGEADCLYIAPASGKHPAVVMWPDIKGRRPAFDIMGRRLAAQGYGVLVVNPFYRDTKGLALPENVTFPSDAAWEILSPMREKLTADAVVSDTQAFFRFLDKQKQVDKSRQGAVMGYCMSGPFAMFAAAAMPNRIGAIATFHGGGLATDEPNSPHLTIPGTDAQVLHAIAENDNEKHPDMKPMLVEAYKKANIPAEIEVYEGTLHGWTPPDSQAYNEEQAEKAWKRMLALFQRAL
ncbi:dienelactone hydrolase family protein [Alteromonas pelagimontana]|uniref:Dienelactone hydrolase family protein n=1 Tax=Alteromonas pelagimontana TaxID=1858656 RepID=A0A6M4MGS9_9ALTE|nr:dienelactone hydrolase family protein [Alteromonas pelagimontana]QJR82283.1 dienelactone hydrolase family protein [Alteromonas pelagimontana]